MAAEEKASVQLAGVPETLLWTLYNRASDARRADGLLHDPLAVQIADAIDYPFAAPLWPADGRACPPGTPV